MAKQLLRDPSRSLLDLALSRLHRSKPLHADFHGARRAQPGVLEAVPAVGSVGVVVEVDLDGVSNRAAARSGRQGRPPDLALGHMVHLGEKRVYRKLVAALLAIAKQGHGRNGPSSLAARKLDTQDGVDVIAP